MNTLVKETDTYKKLLPTLLSDKGKFAVIHGDELIGVFSAYEDAVKIGYERCGLNDQFLVKRIVEDEQISFFTRDLSFPCQA